MGEVGVIGSALAKTVLHLQGAAADGSVAFRRKLRRVHILSFLAKQPRCTVAMEACASAHHRGRAIAEMGRAVKLIPAIYVKPFRETTEERRGRRAGHRRSRVTADHAVCVAVKSEAQQAAGMACRTRDLLVRQRTQTVNALQGRLAE